MQLKENPTVSELDELIIHLNNQVKQMDIWSEQLDIEFTEEQNETRSALVMSVTQLIVAKCDLLIKTIN